MNLDAIKVYVTSCDDENFDFRGLEFEGEYDKIIDYSEEKGQVYSLYGFQEALNDEDLELSNSFVLITCCGKPITMNDRGE